MRNVMNEFPYGIFHIIIFTVAYCQYGVGAWFITFRFWCVRYIAVLWYFSVCCFSFTIVFIDAERDKSRPYAIRVVFSVWGGTWWITPIRDNAFPHIVSFFNLSQYDFPPKSNKTRNKIKKKRTNSRHKSILFDIFCILYTLKTLKYL